MIILKEPLLIKSWAERGVQGMIDRCTTDKCKYCGVQDIRRIPNPDRKNCKILFGYRPIPICSLMRLVSIQKTERNWQAYLAQMDKRDIVAWNDMYLRQKGINAPI
jgi:hypothetical protein